MPRSALLRSFVALWWILGVSLFIGGTQTALGALRSGHGMDSHLVLLGALEALGALFFLVPWTLRLGAGGLLLALSIALVFHLTRQQFRWDLLIFGAAVVFVAIHGTLSADQWRVLFSRRTA
ncbi:MAG: hypothetical protein ACLQIH_15700 [Myxococcaceae bacterium]